MIKVLLYISVLTVFSPIGYSNDFNHNLKGVTYVSESTEGAVDPQKYLELKFVETDGRIAVEIQLIWEPGAEIEIVSSAISFKRNLIYFPFTDSFGSSGFGLVDISKSGTCWIDLIPSICEKNDSRSTRQYGEFVLKMENQPQASVIERASPSDAAP